MVCGGVWWVVNGSSICNINDTENWNIRPAASQYWNASSVVIHHIIYSIKQEDGDCDRKVSIDKQARRANKNDMKEWLTQQSTMQLTAAVSSFTVAFEDRWMDR